MSGCDRCGQTYATHVRGRAATGRHVFQGFVTWAEIDAVTELERPAHRTGTTDNDDEGAGR